MMTTEAIASNARTVLQGLSQGQATIQTAVHARRLAAGEEMNEMEHALGALHGGWYALAAPTSAFRTFVPAPPGWKGSLGLTVIGWGSTAGLKALHHHRWNRCAQLARLAARTLVAVSIAAMIASLASALMAGHLVYVGCALATGLLGVSVERGWLPAALEDKAAWLMTGLAIVRLALMGNYLLVGIVAVGVTYDRLCAYRASRALARAPGRTAGMEEPALRSAIEDELHAAVHRLDFGDADWRLPQLPAGSARPCEIDQGAVSHNYHGLVLERGEALPPGPFRWPEWLADPQSPESPQWSEQMRRALIQQNPDLSDSIAQETVEQLWRRIQTRLDQGFADIRNRRSNGGALYDWAPIDRSVEILQSAIQRASTPEARGRVRSALCGLVGRLARCGAGMQNALVEAVRDDLQTDGSTASLILATAARYRESLVEEAYRTRLNWLLALNHGETGVHAMEQAAYCLPELNLPSLATANNDPAVQPSPVTWFRLRQSIDWNRMWDAEALTESLAISFSASPQMFQRWIEERLPAGDLRTALLDRLGYLPIAEDHEASAEARMSFFRSLSRAMLLDVGMLRPRRG